MTGFSASALATIALTTHLLRRPEAPSHRRTFTTCWQRVQDPSRLLGCDAAGIQSLTGLGLGDAERLASLLDRAGEPEAERERLALAQIRIVSMFDDGYPVRLAGRLGSSTPPLLHIASGRRAAGGPAAGGGG